MPENISQLEKSWIVHPFKERRKVSILLLLFLFSLSLGLKFAFGSIIFSIIAATLLFGSLSNFFFPSRYELYSDKIVISTPFQRSVKYWSYFKSYYSDKHGVLLSPFEFPSRLESFRGIYVRFAFDKDRKDRNELLELIKARVKPDEKMRRLCRRS